MGARAAIILKEKNKVFHLYSHNGANHLNNIGKDLVNNFPYSSFEEASKDSWKQISNINVYLDEVKIDSNPSHRSLFEETTLENLISNGTYGDQGILIFDIDTYDYQYVDNYFEPGNIQALKQLIDPKNEIVHQNKISFPIIVDVDGDIEVSGFSSDIPETYYEDFVREKFIEHNEMSEHSLQFIDWSKVFSDYSEEYSLFLTPQEYFNEFPNKDVTTQTHSKDNLKR